MNILLNYFIGVAVSITFGIIICIIFRSGLQSFLTDIFPAEASKRFWSKVIYTLILLASISGAMANTYPDEAKNDKILMTWSFMNQMEGMGLRLLWTLLITTSILLLVYGLYQKKR